MDVINTVVNSAVSAIVVGLLGWNLRGRFQMIDRRFDAVDRRFEAQEQRWDRMEERFDAKLDSRFNALQASMDAMRSDLTRVALAVGVRDAAENG